MTGILDEPSIERVLTHAFVGRIGTHLDGRTYVVPVTFAYDGTYVYGHSNDGMKLRMMRENPSVCFEVDRVRDLVNWESVIAWGTFEELSGDEALRGLMTIVAHIRPLIPADIVHPSPAREQAGGEPKEPPGTAIVYRIRLHEKTGRFEKK